MLGMPPAVTALVDVELEGRQVQTRLDRRITHCALPWSLHAMATPATLRHARPQREQTARAAQRRTGAPRRGVSRGSPSPPARSPSPRSAPLRLEPTPARAAHRGDDVHLAPPLLDAVGVHPDHDAPHWDEENSVSG